jgi:hypothetical protein
LADVGFHASTVRQKLTAEAQPTFILYLIPPTYLGLKALLEKGLGIFWSRKVPETNVIGTQNPCTFAL